ncbi:MAG TPA: hypothetical protein VGJ29_01160 [Vicinamibacterales bacterium]
MRTRSVACALMLLALGAPAFVAQDYKANLRPDDPAIQYTRAPLDDAAARLAHELEHGGSALDARSGPLGVVPALLARLGVNVDSQMLVFSKTSIQAPRVSPDTPRAIYFSDDVTVAYVPGSPTIEITATDPVQGTVFYTMPMAAGGAPTLARSETCLRCHQGPNTAGVPGIYVGSVIPGPSGAPLHDARAIITDHRTPFRDRWGGWYVTARRGEQVDRANATTLDPEDAESLVRESRQNLATLAGRFDPAPYPAATSDIVALMTFEHQTQMINLLTRVGWEARMAARDGSTDSHADAAVNADIDDLVAYMFFSGEAPLKDPVEGMSSFSRTFSKRGPRDRRGRSLRDFDLRTRLFRYPLSYMIYSAAFDALPEAARHRIYRRLHDVLSGADRSGAYAHLNAEDREAILEILADTKPAATGY